MKLSRNIKMNNTYSKSINYKGNKNRLVLMDKTNRVMRTNMDGKTKSKSDTEKQ